MDTKDWILLFVTVFVGALFSVIISNVSIHLTDKKKMKQNILIRRLELTIPYIEAIRKQIIDACCQLTDNFEETLKMFFIVSGDFQVYLQDNKGSMQKEQNLYKKDYLHIELLEKITEEVISAGKSMKTDENAFAQHYKTTEKLCNEILLLYNATLVELR